MSQQKTERGDGEEEVKKEKGKDKCKVSRRMSWRKAAGKTGAWNEEARKGKEEGVRQEKKTGEKQQLGSGRMKNDVF